MLLILCYNNDCIWYWLRSILAAIFIKDKYIKNRNFKVKKIIRTENFVIYTYILLGKSCWAMQKNILPLPSWKQVTWGNWVSGMSYGLPNNCALFETECYNQY